MKKLLLLIAIGCITIASQAQSINCYTAVSQLQSYAAQVNQIYQAEYWQVIPAQRCPAVDPWGRPYNPVMVQSCRNQMLWNLNNWYGQQCEYVNTMYSQILRGCSNQPIQTVPKPGPRRINGSDENDEIDESQIEDLTAGIDEDKAVRITIPRTPSGFKPKN